MKISLVILIVIFYSCLIHSRKAKFDVYAKSMKLWVDPEYGNIPNMRECKIKTSRKYPGGTASCEGYLLKKVDFNYFIQIKLFYKYGTVYRVYLFDYTRFQPCELMRKNRIPRYNNALADLVLKGIKVCCPLFNHECPYYPGWYNISDIDINGTIAPFLPPVVPVGQYKIYTRTYVPPNRTILETEVTGVCKASREDGVTDFSMLNMG